MQRDEAIMIVRLISFFIFSRFLRLSSEDNWQSYVNELSSGKISVSGGNKGEQAASIFQYLYMTDVIITV